MQTGPVRSGDFVSSHSSHPARACSTRYSSSPFRWQANSAASSPYPKSSLKVRDGTTGKRSRLRVFRIRDKSRGTPYLVAFRVSQLGLQLQLTANTDLP